MKKVRLRIDVDAETAAFLRSVPDAGALVARALGEHRARALEKQLENAYREDADESARLNAVWDSVDTGFAG